MPVPFVYIGAPGGTPRPDDVLFQVAATDRASVPFPLMTTVQKNALTGMAEGDCVFDITLNSPCFYDGSVWVTLYAGVGTYLALSGGTMTGDINLADYQLTRPLLKDYGEAVQAHGNTGTTETLNIEDGNVHTITLDDNVTLTFSNPSASGRACSFTLIATQDGGGGNTITFPGSVQWAGGTPPTLTATGDAVDILTFVTLDAGTTWYGFLAGLDFS